MLAEPGRRGGGALGHDVDRPAPLLDPGYLFWARQRVSAQNVWSHPRGLDRLQQPQSPLLCPGLRRKGNDWTHDHGYPRFRHDRTLAVRRDKVLPRCPFDAEGRVAQPGVGDLLDGRKEALSARIQSLHARPSRNVRETVVKPAQRARRANRLSRHAVARADSVSHGANRGRGGPRPAAAAASPRLGRGPCGRRRESAEFVDEEVEKVPQRQRTHAPTPSRRRRTSFRRRSRSSCRDRCGREPPGARERARPRSGSPERRPLRNYAVAQALAFGPKLGGRAREWPGPLPRPRRDPFDQRQSPPSGASPTSVRESGSPAIAVSADASNPPTLNRPSSAAACAAAVPPALSTRPRPCASASNGAEYPGTRRT